MNNHFYLDLSDWGPWLIKQGDKRWYAGYDKDTAIKAIDALNEAHRPNLEMADKDLVVCWNNHEKGEKCDYEILIKNAKSYEQN